MGYGPRTRGIIDNKGKFKRCTYVDFINYCEEITKGDTLERLRVANAVQKAWDLSFDIRPAKVGINDKKSYIAMWNVYDKDNTYREISF